MAKANPAKNVAILGASQNPERYSFKAIQNLLHKGHHVFPVNPNLQTLLGHRCFNSLQEIIDSEVPIDTLTIYVNSEVSNNLEELIIMLHPLRVIFNPGAENKELEKNLKAQGIETLEACTLVMLNTGQF